MPTWSVVTDTAQSWTGQSNGSQSWSNVSNELPTYVGLEDGISILLMENNTDKLVWGDVWDAA